MSYQMDKLLTLPLYGKLLHCTGESYPGNVMAFDWAETIGYQCMYLYRLSSSCSVTRTASWIRFNFPHASPLLPPPLNRKKQTQLGEFFPSLAALKPPCLLSAGPWPTFRHVMQRSATTYIGGRSPVFKTFTRFVYWSRNTDLFNESQALFGDIQNLKSLNSGASRPSLCPEPRKARGKVGLVL